MINDGVCENFMMNDKCRFCGIERIHRAHINIFSDNYNFVLLSIEKVLHYFPHLDDNLSKFMCIECLALIDRINDFLQTSLVFTHSTVIEFESFGINKTCNLCGVICDKSHNNLDDITSKLSHLFGYSIHKLRNVCTICVSKVHVYNDFIRMVDSTLFSSNVNMTNSNVTVENNIIGIKQEQDGGPHDINNFDINIEIKKEVISGEIVDTVTSNSEPLSMRSSLVNPISFIKSDVNSDIHFTATKKDSCKESLNDHKLKAPKSLSPSKPFRKRKIINYYEEDELSNPDSPDSSPDFSVFNSDSGYDVGCDSNKEKKNYKSKKLNIPAFKNSPPETTPVKDLQPQSSESNIQTSFKRIIKGETTKPSLNLIFTKKRMNNGNMVVYVSVKQEYIENFKHIKPLLGDGMYYTCNDLTRNTVDPKYKDFVIKCIENILSGRLNLMPYLKLTTLPGVKRIMFTCFVCGTTIHNRMIRQAIFAHLMMHLVLLCPTCDVFKNSVSDMCHHLKSHSKSIYSCKFPCKVCDEEITSGPEIYFSHVMSHLFKLFNCSKCNYSTDSIESFSNHYNNICGKGNCEGDCSIRYYTHKELLQHLDELSSGDVNTSYACSNCKMTFHSEELAGIHYDIHGHQHSHIERIIIQKEKSPCYIENVGLLKRYEASRDLDHILGDSNNCPFCKVGFKNSSSEYISKHISVHALLACRACDNCPIYKDFTDFKNHTLIDHTPYFIQCNMCKDVKFRNVEFFLSHILQHI